MSLHPGSPMTTAPDGAGAQIVLVMRASMASPAMRHFMLVRYVMFVLCWSRIVCKEECDPSQEIVATVRPLLYLEKTPLLYLEKTTCGGKFELWFIEL